MHLVVANFRNGVDVVPGIPTSDRSNPEIAVSPQQFIVTFEKPEFIVHSRPGFVQGVFGAVPPSVVVDYWRYLNTVGRHVKPQSVSDAALRLTPLDPRFR
jgi:hypothetical protein